VNGHRALAVLALAAFTSGCVGPSRSDGDFEKKAGNTAKAVASALATARLAADGAGHHKETANYLSVILGEAEDDATAAQATFDSYQPPSSNADKLRTDLDSLLGNAIEGLTALRITARRGQLDRLPTISSQLGPVLTSLTQMQERYG
jgi:alkanesulfonate monooxygenase SsuD/methylene tetrahydromethanopterin reductase-like flavin-dependent oxidoreductase (luciferase family)